MLPAEHRHLLHEDEGADHGGVVHRHYAAHRTPFIPVLGHHDDEGAVEWLPSTVVIMHSSSLPGAAASVPAVFVLVAPSVSRVVVTLPERSAHDPPWRNPVTL